MADRTVAVTLKAQVLDFVAGMEHRRSGDHEGEERDAGDRRGIAVKHAGRVPLRGASRSVLSARPPQPDSRSW
jgi:hypothetical protein